MKEFPQLTQLDLSSNLSPNSREFKQDWLKLLEEHESKMQLALSQGKEKHVSRHLKRGYLLARERIELVLDPDSPFLELMPLAGYDIEGVPSPGASVVTGIGLVW